jgi:hypothetical protein
LGNKQMTVGNRYKFTIKFTKGIDCFIGVASSRFKIDGIFSQSEFGWSYCSDGEIYNNAEKYKYGTGYGRKKLVTVYVDLKDLKVFFGVDRQIFPIAFNLEAQWGEYFLPAATAGAKYGSGSVQIENE